MKKVFKIFICFIMLLIGSFIIKKNVLAYDGDINNLHSQTLLTSYVENIPAITILTHGQGSSASAYSNYNGDFVYDSNSLIERIRAYSYADVYIADMDENEKDSMSFKNFTLYLCKKGNKIEGTNYFEYSQRSVNTICDFTKHAIIILNQYFSDEAHDVAYSELESLIDSISYDYKVVTGKLPKINLIGHSRGGIINLMYATNHPYNVASLISMGTPYNGSVFAGMEDLIRAVGLRSTVNTPSGEDILNLEKQAELKNNWNAMLSNNPNVNINAIAIGSCTSSDYLKELFAGGYIDEKLCELLKITSEDISFLKKLELFLVSLAADGITEYINEHPEVVNGIFRIVDFGIDITRFFSNDTNFEQQEKIQIILNNCYLDYGKLVIMDDLFIDYQSQIAVGYNGFQREKKIFFSDNTDYTKISHVNVPIPHNLEARDSEIISFIMSKLTYDGIAINSGVIAADTIKNLSNRINAVKYSFTPVVSSLYKLSSSNNDLVIIVQDAKNYTTSEHISNDLVKLEKDKKYNIYMHNRGFSYNSNFSIGFPKLNDYLTKNTTILPYESIYITILGTSNNIAKYKTNNNNVKMEVLNSSFQTITNRAENVAFRYAANEKYYIKIENICASIQEFRLTEDSFDVIMINDYLSTTIGNSYSYYKFVAPSTDTFVFDLGVSTVNFSPNVEMYSSAYQLLSNMDTISVKNKNLYSISLTQGQTIYIAIKNIKNYSKSININADVSEYYWMINGNINSTRKVNMNRSGNDKIRVEYYCNGNQLKGNIKFLNGSGQYFTKVAYEDGFVYDIILKNNAELNLDGTTYLSFLFEANVGDIAFVTQEFYVSVDPYIDIELKNTNDVYDYSVIIDVGSSTTISGESINVTLKMKSRNNTLTQTFDYADFDCAKLIPTATSYKVGNLEVSIYSVTYSKNSCSKTYYLSSNSELFSSEYSNVVKKGLIQDGEGTLSSPYLITSFRELNNIREFTVFDSYYETYYIKGYYKMMNDIDYDGEWKPIETCFKGEFDGNGKKISVIKMNITSSNNYYGLFRNTDNAVFKNLHILNIYVNAGENLEGAIIGSICGFATHTYFNGCFVEEGDMGKNYNNYKSSIGGIVGFSNHSTFVNCSAGISKNKLKLYSYGSMGGIAGASIGGSFTECNNYANLYHYWDGSNNRYTGGIVGKSTFSSTFTDCKNYGIIKFAGSKSNSKELAPYMGQIIGYKDASVSTLGCECIGECDYENLRKVGGFMGIGKTNQARYASTGENGYCE